MAQEIEIKLRVKDAEGLRAALKGMGARALHGGTGRVHEWNTVFDTARQDLRKREQQPALLTFKGPVVARAGRHGKATIDERHKVREEIQFRIADAASLAKILERLGMRPSFHYEKYRTTFRLPAAKQWAKGLLIELDETPIGTFVELEGRRKAIDRAAKELGFSKKDYILTNYLSLFAEDCRRRDKHKGDMVFQRRK
jgi:predicted adenylyl cyclase CyaB